MIWRKILNEGKPSVAERFIRTLKNKVYKYMTSVSKHVYIVKLVDTINKNNNRYHHIMNSVDVNSSTFVFEIQIILYLK